MARVRYFNNVKDLALSIFPIVEQGDIFEPDFKHILKVKHFFLVICIIFILEIKTFGLVLEFEMSFQQQQHSVAFMLLYSDLAGRS